MQVELSLAGEQTRPEGPLVSVVMPIRNEEAWIARSISSVQEQLYDGPLEIIVVIGASTDGTREIVRGFAEADPRITVIENADGRTPVSLNLGLRAARGSVIVRVDGHGWVEREDYVASAVDTLARTRADAVGGVVRFVGTTSVGRAIALAEASPLGGGTAAFRGATAETEADGLRWGVYDRRLFERIGTFDESLVRNQDDEFCHRIRLSGGRMVVTPAMPFVQIVRPSLSALWRQYAQWGRFRVATIAKHKRPATPRQLAPPALVGGLALALALELGSRGRIPAGRMSTGAYLTACALGGARIAVRAGTPRLSGSTGAAVATMHLAYGSGFWVELAHRAGGASRTLLRRRRTR